MAAQDQQPPNPVPPTISNPPPPAGGAPPPPATPQPGGSSSPVSQGVVAAPPPPKRGFPKPLLIILGLLVMGALAYVVITFVLPKREVSGGELTWWGLWEDETIIKPLIDEYQQQHPDVTINYVRQSKEDYRERLTSALASGDGPDIFRFHNTWVPMFAKELEPLPASVMSAADFSQTFYPVITNDLTSGIGIVGMPLGFDTLGLYINEDIFDAAGKTPPITWDDLRETAIELTVKDENNQIRQSGVAIGRVENVDHWPEILALMMLQNGADIADPTGELGEAAITYFTIFSNVDRVWDETLPTSTTAFSAGKLAMLFGPSWRAFEIQQQNPDLRFKVVPVPQLPKDDPSQPNVTLASYWVEGVWSRSEHKDLAWDFLGFLSSKDALGKLYANASKTRLFGEPYPRIDMANILASDPVVGTFIKQGPDAQSWYLVSRTFDGPTGINSQIADYYADAVNSVHQGANVSNSAITVAEGVSQVLAQYGILTSRPQ